ncbi:ABC transporter ATP-binding protein [Jeotgalicoccus meleagridis]|jgi:ABC-2 type transport system ATP-binding protein|uniref:ABC transporter ATP-binding protein YtrB n=1 Tax=Jeotgalicoccus meleagridis TaxID=2759181 RepID=A0A6V7RS23_9STAP|nr:ABC transporter ATP-binding protein [Jeotgalicoccus meleagridis]CAD2080667.1 ABC transporter ATP-binding protein YtrB [Jeotgalicoccus meleagridis]HIW38270.1 ABC transporter ATP-binding protein [Candidatus Jeotgalicoccus stercoravium]
MKVVVDATSKEFGKVLATDNINLEIKPATVHGLLGSNGAGKTTLMKIMSGIYKADQGMVTYDGKNIYESPEVKKDVVFLHDIPFFFRGSSLKKMAKLYQSMYSNWSTERFNQLSKHFGLSPDVQLSQLSKGMKRQASFILAFAARPKVMLLDEPFDGLDPIIRKQVKNIMMQDIANHGMTVIASSHNLREMEDLCDSVSIMHQGKLLFNQDLSDIRGNHCKLQIAFKTLPDDDFYKQLNVVHSSQRGRIITCIIKGDISKIEEKVTKYHPLMYDILPLTLEEIFTYEMGELGYEISNIIVE